MASDADLAFLRAHHHQKQDQDHQDRLEQNGEEDGGGDVGGTAAAAANTTTATAAESQAAAGWAREGTRKISKQRSSTKKSDGVLAHLILGLPLLPQFTAADASRCLQPHVRSSLMRVKNNNERQPYFICFKSFSTPA